MFNILKSKPKGEIITLKLSGLHCTSCAVNIDLTLEDIPGVFSSKTNYARSVSVIDFDPTKTKPATLIDQITKLGYRAVPIS